MDSKISGTVLPVLEITLQPTDVLIAESGELAWKTPNVTLHTTTATAGTTSLWGAIGRALSGGGLFMTEYRAENGPGQVAFAAKVPGAILEEKVAAGRGYLVHRHGYLCGTGRVTLTTAFQQKLGSGIFGGNGFMMQKVGGEGTAWVELGGEVVTKDLRAGEVLDVHPGHVGMLEESVSFDITTIPGVRNKLFGGDGFFLARLTGPGRVWLQTLTVPHLAHAIEPYLPRSE